MLSAQSQLFYASAFVQPAAFVAQAESNGTALIAEMNHFCSRQFFSPDRCRSLSLRVGSKFGPEKLMQGGSALVATTPSTTQNLVPGALPQTTNVSKPTVAAALYTLGGAQNTTTQVCNA